MAERTYHLTVEGWGEFEVWRITPGMMRKIRLEVERYTEGETQISEAFAALAQATAHLRVLAKKPPAGWDFDNLDPLDPETDERLFDFFTQVRDKEKFFRNAPGGDGPSRGKESGGVGGVVVSPDVQPGAE